MSHHHESPEYEQQPDADVWEWFAALGPPPTAQTPPDLRVSVQAKIKQRRRARRGLKSWLTALLMRRFNKLM